MIFFGEKDYFLFYYSPDKLELEAVYVFMY